MNNQEEYKAAARGTIDQLVSVSPAKADEICNLLDKLNEELAKTVELCVCTLSIVLIPLCPTPEEGNIKIGEPCDHLESSLMNKLRVAINQARDEVKQISNLVNRVDL
ncbi:MAG: hypothetical protein DRH06_00355 [Deltaproteobacteria bacterium]|nr:MAG: hypothetical protein DRH06_00355 [Deltaproteobacteria bacterium]